MIRFNRTNDTTNVARARSPAIVANIPDADIRELALKAAETQLAASRYLDARGLRSGGCRGSDALPAVRRRERPAHRDRRLRICRRYLSEKRDQWPSDDPVEDLCTAWDNRIAFARKTAALYPGVYALSLPGVQAAAEEARRLLCNRLVRCAEAGKLKTKPDEESQTCSGLVDSSPSNTADDGRDGAGAEATRHDRRCG